MARFMITVGRPTDTGSGRLLQLFLQTARSVQALCFNDRFLWDDFTDQ